MAVVTLGVGWLRRDHTPNHHGATTAPVSTEVESRQPLVVFPVYIGCAQPPLEVVRDGRRQDMPVTVFDHRPFELVVHDTVRTAVRVTVQLGPDQRMYLLDGPGVFVGGYLSVGTALVPVCS